MFFTSLLALVAVILWVAVIFVAISKASRKERDVPEINKERQYWS
mgnify:CR=1 FL=1